ncbi:copper resistance protein B [Larsenimonas salina]|uniref:copper resistance protein B n=1 Tax=Larsenimonas salina TaxID=1295565 RepID=UPI002073564F|nr:copper resistance protein B [Larsenimonas salina]MCM5705148.1 copper resistance protein B [Larsenimonas salina]
MRESIGRWTCLVVSLAMALGMGTQAQSAPRTQPLPGKASLDEVVPAHADPRSGSPAHWAPPVDDKAAYHTVRLDRLEHQGTGDREAYVWDAEAWWGNDRHRLWLKTEGEGDWRTGERDHAEVQALYNRMWDDFWDVQVGLRHDIDPHPSRSYGVFGLQGLAPYGIDTEASLFVSERGDTSARLELEYEWLITQRWVLSPRLEVNASAQRLDELDIGQGITTSETGLRLGYDVTRQVSPYVGISWQNTYGETRRMRDRDEADRFAVVAGISAWY